ncbi:MAG TPA: hypothetical protein VF530_13965 [Planctomycetota bacterium]
MDHGPTDTTRGGLRLELALVLSAALLFALAVHFLEGATIPRWPYHPLLIQSAGLAAALGLVIVTWLSGARAGLYPRLALVVALGSGLGLLLDWQSYPIGPGALGSDALFNTAIVVKRSHGLGNVDFSYRGLSAFYPSLYHWVVGTLARWTDTPAPLALKHGFYWLAFLLPLATHALWRRVLAPAAAFLAMVLTLVVVRGGLAFKPYEMLSLALFVPWALRHLVGLRPGAEVGVPTRRELLLGGTLGALLFMSFYYPFFVLATWLPIQALVELRRGGPRAAWSRLKPGVQTLGLVLLFASPYWGPLLGDLLRHGLVSYQNRYFQPYMLSLPFEGLGDWTAVAGLAALVLLAPRDATARALLALAVGVLAFLALGHAGMLLGFPLLHERMTHVEELVAAVGLALGVQHLADLGARHLPGAWRAAPVVGLAALASLGMAMEASREIVNTQHQAAEKYAPPALLSAPAFGAAVDGRVLLSGHPETVALWPAFLFLQPVAQFNHPAARYRERLALLLLLGGARDPEFVSWMLQHNRYDRVELVHLKEGRLEAYDEVFPQRENNVRVELRLAPEALAAPGFRAHPAAPGLLEVLPLPPELWRGFDAGERRLAALFCDVAELQAELPPGELDALRADLHALRREHQAWRAAFEERWGTGAR